PSSRDAKRAISDTAMNGALAALGYDSHTHVPHGGRSSFSTIANESGLFDPMVVEGALAHKIPGSVAAIYNRAQYANQRRRLMQWWADRCDEMKADEPAKLIALRPAVVA